MIITLDICDALCERNYEYKQRFPKGLDDNKDINLSELRKRPLIVKTKFQYNSIQIQSNLL